MLFCNESLTCACSMRYFIHVTNETAVQLFDSFYEFHVRIVFQYYCFQKMYS